MIKISSAAALFLKGFTEEQQALKPCQHSQYCNHFFIDTTFSVYVTGIIQRLAREREQLPVLWGCQFFG